MARLDRVKNLTGLAEWFAGNERLRKLVNLVIVGTLLLTFLLVTPSLSSTQYLVRAAITITDLLILQLAQQTVICGEAVMQSCPQ